MSDADLKEKEQDAAIDPDQFEKDFGRDFSDAEQQEMNSLSDQVGAGYSAEKTKNKRKFWTRKRVATGGGIAGLLVGGGMAFFGVIQGPMQLIHFGKLLEQFHFSAIDDFTNGRTIRFMSSMRRTGLGTAVAQTRLGTLSNTVADRVERRLNDRAGLRSLYDQTTGKLIGYEIIDEAKAIDTLGDIDGSSPDFETAEPGSRANYRRLDGTNPERGIIEFRDTKIKFQRRFTQDVLDVTNTNKVASKISSRLLIRRGGIDFHVLENTKRKAGQSLLDFYRDRRSKRNEQYRSGDTSRRYTGDETEIDDDGNEVTTDAEGNEINTNGNDVANELNGVGDEVVDAIDSGVSLDIKSIARNAAAKAKGPAIVAAIICAANDISAGSDDFVKLSVIAPMMRMGGSFMSAASQVQAFSAGDAQDISLDAVGEMVDLLHSEEFGSAFAAASIQSELNQPVTGPDIDSSAKLENGTKKPAVLSFLDQFGWIGTLCGVTDSVISKIPGAGIVANIQDSIINGGLGIFGTSSDEIMGELLGLVTGAAVDPNASGASLGNLANHGARWAANEQFMSLGGAALSNSEVSELDSYLAKERQSEFQNTSISNRLFAVSQPYSLLGNIVRVAPNSASSFLKHTIGSLPQSLLTLNPFLQRVEAQTNSYSYGFGELGFSLADQNDERFEDPYEIRNYLYTKEGAGTRLDQLNNEYGSACFGVTVDIDGNIRQMNTSGQPKTSADLPGKCAGDSLDLKYYRFYIADTFTIHSLACYEGIEESCSQVGVGGERTASAPEPTSATPGVDTSGQQCPSDSLVTDGGIADKYSQGRVLSHKIRLCIIKNDQNFDVNVSIAQNMANLVRAAAADGIDVSVSSAYRTFDHQADLRISNKCPDVFNSSPSSCPTPTAIPGKSNHEEGLAIDFRGIEKCPAKSDNKCTDPTNQLWTWLNENASKYGLKQLDSEAWHWSSTGS